MGSHARRRQPGRLSQGAQLARGVGAANRQRAIVAGERVAGKDGLDQAEGQHGQPAAHEVGHDDGAARQPGGGPQQAGRGVGSKVVEEER